MKEREGNDDRRGQGGTYRWIRKVYGERRRRNKGNSQGGIQVQTIRNRTDPFNGNFTLVTITTAY